MSAIAAATEVRKLYIFLCGYEIIRKSACTRGLGDRFILAVPICAYLLDTARGLVMFDTGLDSAPWPTTRARGRCSGMTSSRRRRSCCRSTSCCRSLPRSAWRRTMSARSS